MDLAAGQDGEAVDWPSVRAWDGGGRHQRASRTNGVACCREVLGPCWTMDMQNIKKKNPVLDSDKRG